MKKDLKILVVQNGAVIADKKANFDRVSELLSPYQGKEVDLIILPEVWNIGWNCESFPEMAEVEDSSETLKFLSEIAALYKANVLGGSYIRKLVNGELRNSCPVFNREGNLLCQYDKMHLYSHCGAGEGKYVTKGDNLVMAETDVGKIGLTICYDLRFPELFRKYTFSGSDLLVNMGAWAKTKKTQWMALQKARAVENQSFMIAVSQTGVLLDGEPNLGCSMVVNPLGEVVASLDDNEGVLECTINLEEMYSLRENIPTLLDVCDEYKFLEV